MSVRKDLWNTKENADAYDAYARTFSMYKETSRDLIAISGIQQGMTIVDLAAGTGATSQAIFDKTDNNARVILLDQAEEMLKKAKEKFAGKNTEYIVSPAEGFDEVIHESIDAVICNSAFWQMKARPVFISVSHILKQNGIFAFNLPDSFFNHKDFKKQPIKQSPYSLDDLISWGREVGLTLVTQSVKGYEKTAEEISAFSEIPVMERNSKPKPREKSVGNSPRRGEWIYFVFKKEY